MKKHLLGFMLFVTGLAHAQSPIAFKVKGKIGYLNSPAKIYLIRGFENKDSAIFKNGSFEFKGTIEAPRSADLVIKRDGKFGNGMFGINDATRIYLESSLVVITSPDSLRKAHVTGGPVNADDQRLQDSLKTVFGKMKAFEANIKNTPEEQRNAPDFVEHTKAVYKAFNNDLVERNRNFIKANPNSWVSLDALEAMNMWQAPQYSEVAPLYAAFSPALKRSPQGQRYGELVKNLKETAVGEPAPAFTLQTPEGITVSLTDYCGKYLLIDFWASWCGPCRAENPSIIKVYNEFKGRNFDIIGVSLDNEKDRENWLKAVQDDHLVWTQVSDLKGWQSIAAQRYHIRSIPQNFLIDPTGKIIAFNLRSEEMKILLAHLIK